MFGDVIRFNRLIRSWQGCDELYWTCLEFNGEDAAISFSRYHDFNDFSNFNVDDPTLLIASVECKEELPILPITIKGLGVYNVSALSLGNLLPSLAGTKELESLQVEKCEGLEYILTSVVHSVDGLKYLWVNNMPDLRGLSNSLSVVGFFHIKKLVIEKCPKIKVLFPRKLLQQDQALFPLMETLKVEECDELEEIFEGGGRDNCSNSNPNTILIDLPKLRSLDLRQLPKLRRIYRHLHLCTSLVYLSVEDCAEIEQIFEGGGRDNCSNPNPNSILVDFPKLISLDLYRLPKLRRIYRHLHLCTLLKNLTVEDCPEIEQIFKHPNPSLLFPS